jgi:hypothetical protein
MTISSFVFRIAAMAMFALTSMAAGFSPANAAGDIYVHAGANFNR